MEIICTQKDEPMNPYSIASFYCELLRDKIMISNATCFFVKCDGQTYLVTNHHVLSGRNSDTGEILDKNAAEPNRIKVFMPKKDGENVVYGEETFQIFELYDQEEQLWKDKMVGSRFIDVAVLKVDVDECFIFNSIEEVEQPFNENTDIEIASSLFVIGFPFGRIGGVLPIWKKASVASEPNYESDEGFPYFWADTATKKGMSGSPVIYYQRRPVTLVNESEKKVSYYFTKFVGVYSGRIDKDPDSQLGRVWKASIIDELIQRYK